MPDTLTRARRRARCVTIDPLMDAGAIAQALSLSPRTVKRRLKESLVSRSGLWPQLNDNGRVVVHASTLAAYMAALPSVEDCPTSAPPR